MKLRNRLLALVLLAVFVGAGFLYFNTWVVQKPFGIVLFISDGLVPSNMAAARLYVGGASHQLEMEKLPYMAMLRNEASDFAVPDAAAASTALATGVKCRNGVLSRDATNKALPSLITIANRSGRKCGIVTNGSLADPSLAAFYANAEHADHPEELIQQLVALNAVDLALGGGRDLFFSEAQGGARKDEKDLLLELRRAESREVRSREELNDLSPWNIRRAFGLFAGNVMAFRDQHPQSGSQPSLTQLTQRAIEILQTNPKGYFLVIDAGLVREAAKYNQGERTLAEIIELDSAIKAAREYAGENAMIIVAGTTDTGGLRLNGYPFSREQGVAILGTNPFGLPSLTWSTGPNGPRDGMPASNEPAAFYKPTAEMVASDVLAFGAGEGAKNLSGVIPNTALFDLIRAQF